MRRKRTVPERLWFGRPNIAGANVNVTVQVNIFFSSVMAEMPLFGFYLCFYMITPTQITLGEYEK